MSRFGSPPASDFEVHPTRDDVDFFEENGFLVVPQITTEEELAWMTEVMLAVLDDNAGTGVFEPGWEQGQTLPPQIQQSIGPELMIPELLDTTFRRNARRFAAALLDVPEADLTSWGHMIRKPAHSNRPAPWHQDMAYWQPELDYHAIGCWLPLHEVTVERGCMQFIPGSHKGELRHHDFQGDPAGNLLIVHDVDASQAVACPLPAGGATFHHHLTLHYTAPNTTDLDRLACPTEFQLMPWRREEPVEWDWIQRREAATGHKRERPSVIADGKFLFV
jgi:ectoine hydroxylase-related dioxygenase (phytanoyl-CoA dioxygenase family)